MKVCIVQPHQLPGSCLILRTVELSHMLRHHWGQVFVSPLRCALNFSHTSSAWMVLMSVHIHGRLWERERVCLRMFLSLSINHVPVCFQLWGVWGALSELPGCCSYPWEATSPPAVQISTGRPPNLSSTLCPFLLESRGSTRQEADHSKKQNSLLHLRF